MKRAYLNDTHPKQCGFRMGQLQAAASDGQQLDGLPPVLVHQAHADRVHDRTEIGGLVVLDRAGIVRIVDAALQMTAAAPQYGRFGRDAAVGQAMAVAYAFPFRFCVGVGAVVVVVVVVRQFGFDVQAAAVRFAHGPHAWRVEGGHSEVVLLFGDAIGCSARVFLNRMNNAMVFSLKFNHL